MKILLLENNIKWKSLDKRVPKFEKYLNKVLDFTGTHTIERKSIKEEIKIDSWDNRLDTIWYRSIYKKYPKYDAVGMVISRKDWKGEKNHGGFYVVNSDRQHQFYIICDENSTTKVRGKRVKQVEEFLEHELAGHGMQHSLGFLKVNNTKKYIQGQDNTHYFFYHDTKGNYYKDLKEQYTKLQKKLESKIQKIKDQIAQLMKSNQRPNALPNAPQPLVERQVERLILASKLVYGYDLRVTSFYRSFEEQNALYEKGRTKPGKIVTNAKGGQSLHNYAVAFDLVDRKKGYDIDFKKIWLLWNYITEGKGTWGGNWKGLKFKDYPHFENTLGYKLSDFQKNNVDYTEFQ